MCYRCSWCWFVFTIALVLDQVFLFYGCSSSWLGAHVLLLLLFLNMVYCFTAVIGYELLLFLARFHYCFCSWLCVTVLLLLLVGFYCFTVVIDYMLFLFMIRCCFCS